WTIVQSDMLRDVLIDDASDGIGKVVREIAAACAKTLLPWGIAFAGDRAVVASRAPEKATLLREQFEAAWARLSEPA
ncbi:MAG: hypothetical protein AAFU79_20135, partial [Myxococcota bacterium]